MAIKSADQITIVDVTDAYSVILTSEAYTFVGNTTGAPAGLECTTQAVAYCGQNKCTDVTVDESAITCPTGIKATVTNSGTSAVTIKFATIATMSTACEATIPVVVDGITVNKKFSFAVAKTGTTGATGAAGKGITGITTKYLASANNTGVTTSTTGWTDTIQATSTSKPYLWSYQIISYTTGSPTNTNPVIIGTHGATGQTGAAGADAITITITSSAGTVFKNNSGSTVLTAHVFKGGVEQTVSDTGVVSGIGTVKWYEGDPATTTGVAAKTKTVTAASVTNTKTITAQIE